MQEDDLDLFRQAMQDVEPLKTNKAAEVSTAKLPKVTPGQIHRKHAAQTTAKEDENYLATEYVDYLKPHDLLNFKNDGVQHGVFKNLRLGKYTIDARLDLHRKSVKQARTEVFEFIRSSTKRDYRTILVIHGKGEQSQPQQAILKSFTNKWLRQIPEVLAFHSAQKFHGGIGATYVLLRKSERKKQETREQHQRR